MSVRPRAVMSRRLLPRGLGEDNRSLTVMTLGSPADHWIKGRPERLCAPIAMTTVATRIVTMQQARPKAINRFVRRRRAARDGVGSLDCWFKASLPGPREAYGRNRAEPTGPSTKRAMGRDVLRRKVTEVTIFRFKIKASKFSATAPLRFAAWQLIYAPRATHGRALIVLRGALPAKKAQAARSTP